MKTLLKFFFILILIVIIVIFACLFIISSSPRVMQNLVMFAADNFLEDMTIRNLVIKKQVCGLPKQFTFQDVSLVLTQGGETFDLSFEAIRISNILSGLGTTLQLKGGTVKAAAFSLEGLDVRLVSANREQWIGPASVRVAESNGFKVMNINAKTVIKADRAIFEDISGDSYKGKITGTATVYFMPMPHYFADVAFDDLDTVEMEDVNPSLFSQVRGEISGTIEVQGPAGGLEKIDMDVRLKDGGEIQAKALEPLLAYIPKSVEKESLETAIEDNSLISVNNARLRLGNQDSKTVSADIQLKSDNFNLDVNVTVDIIIEGGMQSLLKYFTQLAQFMKG